jgi:hypothetical protein
MLKLSKSFIRLAPIFFLSYLYPFSYGFSDITVKSSTAERLELSYRPGALSESTISANGKTYTLYQYDNHRFSSIVGAPCLPVKTILFAAPKGNTPVVAISGLSKSTLPGIILAPRPKLVRDKSGMTDEIYSEDPSSYSLSGFHPSNYAILGDPVSVGSLTIWSLSFYPVLYDAYAKAVSAADSFDVSIVLGGVPGKVPFAVNIPESVLNRDAFLAPSGAERPVFKTAIESQSPFSKGDWYRIAISESGMYSISGVDLDSAGLPAGSIKFKDIHMYYGGGKVISLIPHDLTNSDFREIHIKVKDLNNNGFMDFSDSIIFYGESLSRFIAKTDSTDIYFQNHPYSKNNIYWLTISSGQAPDQMSTVGETPSDTIAPRTTYREKLHFENDYALAAPESGIDWYWSGISNSTKGFSFLTPGWTAGDSTIIRIGFLNDPSTILPHVFEFLVNDNGPYDYKMPPVYDWSCQFFSMKELTQSNQLKIRELSGDPLNPAFMDWFEVEYTRTLEYLDNGFEFFIKGAGNPVKLTVSKVMRPNVEIYDTTDSYKVNEVAGSYDSENHTLTLQMTLPGSVFSRLTFCEPTSYKRISSIARKNQSDLRNPSNGANYIAISHQNFMDDAKRLAAWRAQDSTIEPLKSMAVNVTDVYDEFAWGVYDPAAIRDFLTYAWKNYNPGVSYCCLIGDTTYKYKNIASSQSSKNLIPTFSYLNMTSDDFYTWTDETFTPSLSIGRLCVNTVEEAKTLISKIIDYEKNPEMGKWHDRMLLVADDEINDVSKPAGTESEFTVASEILDTQNYIPQNIERVKLYEIEYPLKNFQKPDATEAFLKIFNDGNLIANFFGHGNRDLITHEHLLVGPRDIERVNNGPRQPLFFFASCEVGSFDRVDYTSLAELLHLRKEGGCIAVIAAANQTYQSDNAELTRAFYPNLFNSLTNPEFRIGTALKKAKSTKNDFNISSDFARKITGNYFNRYVLFGDPATRLMIPRYAVSASAADTLYRLQKVDIPGEVKNGSTPVRYKGTLSVEARGPIINKRYVMAVGRAINYTGPGKLFYNGDISISGDSFTTGFVVPKDITGENGDSRIAFFATGDAKEASGLLEHRSIGGLYPGAPSDETGPEIKLSFNGKVFKSGDYVRRQPTLQAVITDPSGINIYGERGHNITFTLDKSDITVITDQLNFKNGYTTGTIEYMLPVLSPGEHTFEMSVYDTYNNVSKFDAKMFVVGSETGDITIQNLLNYPNPMKTGGTTFTFSLTDDAGYADIKVYSQSGRLVEKVQFSAGYGFNQIFWRPSADIANGVYFYKLTVRSLNGRKASKIEKLVVMK